MWTDVDSSTAVPYQLPSVFLIAQVVSFLCASVWNAAVLLFALKMFSEVLERCSFTVE